MCELPSRERMRRALTGELPDRIPLCETSIWPETLERWRREGMPADVDPLVWLGMDRIVISDFDCSLRLPVERLCEDEETYVERDAEGAVWRRWKHKSAVPQHIDSVIQTPDDWLKYRDRLAPARDRVPPNYGQLLSRSKTEDFWLAVKPREPVWWILMTMGFERGLEFIADFPDVAEEMIAT
ncbi:MAG: hypothetical protein H5T86_13170, partial [Armatimonadetes bacterium]|nr:hypothetical protein [Armatimonadota bacterium]